MNCQRYRQRRSHSNHNQPKMNYLGSFRRISRKSHTYHTIMLYGATNRKMMMHFKSYSMLISIGVNPSSRTIMVLIRSTTLIPSVHTMISSIISIVSTNVRRLMVPLRLTSRLVILSNMKEIDMSSVHQQMLMQNIVFRLLLRTMIHLRSSRLTSYHL